MDYAALRAAYAALSPAPASLADAAATLNTQTRTSMLPVAPVPVASVHGVLLLAPSLDWQRIETLAATPYSAGWPASPAQADMLVAAARNAVTLATSQVTAIQPADWGGFLASLSVLSQAGAVSAASLAAVQALAVFAQPAWSPALTVGDLQTALAQP